MSELHVQDLKSNFVSMVWLTIIVIAMGLQPRQVSAQDDGPLYDFLSEADQFFNTYVIGGEVAYYALRDDSQPVDEVVAMLADVDLSSVSAEEKKAFYINAYNVIAIYSVINNDIAESVMNRDEFFEKDKYNVAGEMLTLNQIENKKLRAPYEDPRTHFVLVCAAKSCPRLMNFAFYPDRLEHLLEAATYDFLNNPAKTKVNTANETVKLSQIMKWFEGDFKWEASSLLKYTNTYRLKTIPEGYTVDFYEYDWSLNAMSPIVNAE